MLMGPNPIEGETTGELSEGLITEKGEPKMLVGLLEAELLGCCEDMAISYPVERMMSRLKDNTLRVTNIRYKILALQRFLI